VKYQKPDEPLIYEEVWQCLNAGYGGGDSITKKSCRINNIS